MTAEYRILREFVALLKNSPVVETPRYNTSGHKLIFTPDPNNHPTEKLVIHISLSASGRDIIFKAPSLDINVSEQVTTIGGASNGVLFTSFKKVLEQLDGNQIEVDTSGLTEDELFSREWYDTWQAKYGSVYDTLIHPEVLHALSRYSDYIPASGVVIDLGGGDGGLVKKMHELPKLVNKIFYIIDNHTPSLQAAKQSLMHLKNVRILPPTNITKASDLYHSAGPASLITIIGVLCQGVLSREDSRRIMHQTYDALAENGVCIVTALQPILLSALEFRKLGFNILQMSVPKNIIPQITPSQLYVLRKD